MCAQVLGERAGVDVVQTGDFFLFKPFGEGAVGQPVTVSEGVVLSDNGAAMYP